MCKDDIVKWLYLGELLLMLGLNTVLRQLAPTETSQNPEDFLSHAQVDIKTVLSIEFHCI
jgi:hypothetical protein